MLSIDNGKFGSDCCNSYYVVAAQLTFLSIETETIQLNETYANSLASPIESSTGMHSHIAMPYRLEFAGGWLDQPSVSSFSRGSVMVTSAAKPSLKHG
jgi:hypothetical protein